jgi:DNA replication protein DnaC
MNHTQTLDKLHSLRFEGMIQALEEQRRDPNISQLDFEERLAFLVERQWLWRENRSLASRLNNAGFKIKCSQEDIDYQHSRGLKRAQIQQLHAADWVDQNRNCLILGPTGVGKTFLSCAIGHQACREGYRAIYYYAPKLFRALHLAQADGSLGRLLKKLVKADLLIVDDLGIATVTTQQYRQFLEVLDDRCGVSSTLITSQVPIGQWHELIEDPTLADAILDRLVHNSYKLELKGESMRKKLRPKKQNQKEG